MEAEPPEFRSQAEPGNEKKSRAWEREKKQSLGTRKQLRTAMPIFMHEGGYGAFAPAMLV